jgi:hypothetical protein
MKSIVAVVVLGPPDPVTHLLYAIEKIGREDVHFKAPMRNLGRADAWLRDFWKKRLPLEKAFLAEAQRESSQRASLRGDQDGSSIPESGLRRNKTVTV